MHKYREQIDYSTSIEGSTIFFLGYLMKLGIGIAAHLA